MTKMKNIRLPGRAFSKPAVSHAAPNPDVSTKLLRVSEAATDGQRRRALWLCLLIGLVALACIPVAQLSQPYYPDFFAAYQTGLIAAFLISAYLIFALYRGSHAPAQLFLCCGCVYAGALLALQLFSYPTLASPYGSEASGPHATIWLWILWHAALPLAISLYAACEWRKPRWVALQPERTAGWFAAGLMLLLAASLAGMTEYAHYLPLPAEAEDFSGLIAPWLGPLLLVNIVLAQLLLWRATAFGSLLHCWLGVALVALLFDTVMTLIGGSRLSVGWYVGQGNALIAAAIVLLVCMGEINRAYVRTVNSLRRLATANALLEAKVDQAGLDHLTGLPGRALFIQRVRALRARNIGKGTIVAVMLVDLDGFKRINDTFGHERGDQVLVQTGEVLRSALRDTDVAGRFGGDEFVVCLFAPFAVVQAVMIQIAGRIVQGVAQLGNGVGCSVGISLCCADRLNLDAAMQQADEAMYLAKEHGKNRFVIYGQPHATIARLSA
jgi:diguanylate cyclase (GGDEF)-like protein